MRVSCDIQIINLSWACCSFYVGIQLWYVVHSTHTWILYLSSRYEDPVQLYIAAYIRDKLFSESGHLASYVSCQYAMAYDKGANPMLTNDMS